MKAPLLSGYDHRRIDLDEFSHADIAHTRHVIDRLEHRWATRLQQDA
jgi:hypothetical protein